MNIEHWPLDKFVEYIRNPRRNDHAVDKIAAAIHEFGFRIPILAKSDGLVVDGHLRLKAARKLGLATVPVLLADDLTETQIKAFRLSVNRMAELAEWDNELLSLELQDLTALDYNLDLLGWDGDELARLLDGDQNNQPEPVEIDDIVRRYAVQVDVDSEQEQLDVIERFIKDGLKCKPLIF